MVSIDDPDNDINVDALFHQNGQFVAPPDTLLEKQEKTEAGGSKRRRFTKPHFKV